MISRTRSKTVLGVTVYATMDIDVMKLALDAAVVIRPGIASEIASVRAGVNAASNLVHTTVNKLQEIVSLKEQVKSGKRVLETATKVFSTTSGSIVGQIGITPSANGVAPNPAAQGAVTPTMNAVVTATQALQQLEDEIDAKTAALVILSQMAKQEAEAAVVAVMNKIENMAA